MTDFLAGLARHPWYRGQVVHVERQPARPARHATPDTPLSDALDRHLAGAGIDLYTHQAETVDRWRHGDDVLVATGTASGKSLAYNLVVAEALLADPAATALYLFPTKALARDQLQRLGELDAALRLSARPAAYDGDTPRGQRARIRRESRLIVTNPYGLHEYLPQFTALQRFLGNLAVVVVDEAHRYRGVFGSHVALVLRRLQRICSRLGAHPRFVLTSATVANPAQHGQALVGRPVGVVDDDGGPRGDRAVALWDSLRDPERSAAAQAATVVASLARSGLATLCFTGSRVGAELVAGWAQSQVPDRAVSPYRAGYTPVERRRIEQQLRDGTLDAVVSTNALELGVDIGGLDAAVLVGYPGTVASTWQQAGRAGRAGQPALAVLVAGDDPLDQYLVRRPATLFGAPVEHAVVSLTNPDVLAGQVLCAAAELPVRVGSEAAAFGAGLPGVLDALGHAGLVSELPTGHVFTGTFRPAAAVRLDGRGDGSVEVRAGGELVEVLERWRAVRQAHDGAVLLHRGQRFRIRRLDLEAGYADAEPLATAEHTEPTVSRDVTLGDSEATRATGSWSLHLAPVVISQTVVAYKLKLGDEVLDTAPLDLPPVELVTRALWASPPVGYAERLARCHDPLGSLHAAEHALIHAMPLLAMCDRGDVGGLSTTSHLAAGGPMLLLYDGHPGGAGVVDVAYERFDELVALAADMVDSCDCGSGCPRCVYDRNCGSDNQPMDRRGAVVVLDGLLGEAPGGISGAPRRRGIGPTDRAGGRVG